MSLRKELIKLAYENPELREDLVPLLKEAAGAKMQVLVNNKEVARPSRLLEGDRMRAFEQKLMIMFGLKAGSYKQGTPHDQGYGEPGTFNRVIRSWNTSNGQRLEIVIV